MVRGAAGRVEGVGVVGSAGERRSAGSIRGDRGREEAQSSTRTAALHTGQHEPQGECSAKKVNDKQTKDLLSSKYR